MRAGSLFDGHRLTGQHRFVDARSAVGHDAVDRHLLTGTHAQRVADVHVAEGNVFLRFVRSNATGGLWLQSQLRTNGRRGMRAGPQLEHLAEQRQRHDDRRGFEVDRDAPHFAELFRKQRWRDSSKKTVEIRRSDADPDQRPHVWTAAANRTACENPIFIVLTFGGGRRKDGSLFWGTNTQRRKVP